MHKQRQESSKLPLSSTRQPVCVFRSTDARPCNHFCCGKSTNMSYFQSVFVVLGIQHKMRMRRVVCALPRSTWSHKQHDFRKKKKSFSTQNVCFDFTITFVWSFSHSKNKWARCDQNVSVFIWSKCIGLHLIKMYRSSSKVAVIRVRFYWNFEFSQQIFEKYSNIKFNKKNYSSGSRVALWE